MKAVGKNIRFGKVFDGDKNVVIAAMDHGAQMGAIPGLINLPETVEKLAGADAILLNAETLGDYSHVFAHRNAPALLARVTWTTSYCFPWDYDEGHTTSIMAVGDALACGADMVVACLVVKSGDQSVDRENIKIFADIVKEANACGIPVLGEAYPLGGDFMSREDLQKVVGINCRMLWELGADAIKTFYTGPEFPGVVESVNVPVVVLGAAKRDSELEALEMVESAVGDGARGVAFGRNIFQAARPEKFLDGLKEVVNKTASAAEAAEKYGLK